MADYTENYDDIVFLDSEIVDEDADAPVGALIINDGGKVKIASDNRTKTGDGLLPSADAGTETHTAETASETAEMTESAAPTEKEPEKTSGAAEEEKTDGAGDGETAAAEQDAREEISYTDIAEETAAQNAAEQETSLGGANAENAETISLPATTLTTDNGTTASEESAAKTSDNAADAAKPQKTKTAAKKAVSVTIQSAADGSDVWGKAVIKPVKKAKTKEKNEEEATDMAKDTAKTDKPVKTAAKDDKAQTKKAADKKTDKAETVKAAPKKPAKTEKPSAKTTPVKEEKAAKPTAKKNEATEQVLEAGDDSAPHGKFVIKKTDKGNFVYKLYSFNYRVVAIGGEQYASLATCKAGVNSVKNNADIAPIEDRTLQKWEEKKCPKWQIYADKKGEIRLRLLASNGNIIATTNDGYLSKEAAKKGIAAIARACKGADVVRNDNLW